MDAPHDPDPLLPLTLTTLIGRESDLATLGDWLADSETRLVTILGVGGIGKTRLALEAARRALPSFEDGARFVELGSLRDAGLVPETILRSVAQDAADLDSAEGALVASLRQHNQLLVLDCFEHLLDALPLVSRLLSTCPRLKVLATSRERLRLSGARELWLLPLALPETGVAVSPADALASPSVKLFVERARASVPALDVTPENAGVIAAICQRLDGLPLAIELAASRCTHLTPNALLPLLAQRLSMLVGGNLDAPPRHRTMRDSIAWSVDLLGQEEQRAFRRLGVLPGSFSLSAAAHVVAEDGEPEVLRALQFLASLVDKSLLLRDDSLDGEPRFVMLDTIREYALEQLAVTGDDRSAQLTHAVYVQQLASRLAATAPGSMEESLAVLEMEGAMASMRSALSFLRDSGLDDEHLSLLVSLARFWRIASRQPEGAQWLAEALATRDGALDAQTGLAFESLGLLYRDMGDYRSGWIAFERSLAAYEAAGDARGRSRAHNSLGALAIDRGDPKPGRFHNEAALAIQRERGDQWGIARSLHNLGWIAIEDGSPDEARRLFSQSVDLWSEAQDLDSMARALNSLGGLASMQEDFRAAITRYEEALEVLRGIGARSLVAESLVDLAAAHIGLREIPAAAGHLHEALSIYRRIGNRFRFAEAVEVSAALALLTHRFTLADRWLRCARRLRSQTGIAPAATWAARLAAWEAETQQTLAGSGEMDDEPVPMETLIDEPLRLADELRGHVAVLRSQPQRLSHREREVIELVAAGMTDQQIADALFISRRTASRHVAAILEKLEVPTRSAAAAVAIRDGLL
jgi:predicted ATPase/DNA-binding CsgD family transcriptional regulator